MLGSFSDNPRILEGLQVTQPNSEQLKVQLASRAVDRLLRLQEGTPRLEWRKSLGPNRRVLDELVQEGCLKEQAELYLPTCLGVERYSSELRAQVQSGLHRLWGCSAGHGSRAKQRA
jgi:hypothetical protein